MFYLQASRGGRSDLDQVKCIEVIFVKFLVGWVCKKILINLRLTLKEYGN